MSEENRMEHSRSAEEAAQHTIFHIVRRKEWAQAAPSGYYFSQSLDAEGFIHCSTAAQLLAVANRFYWGQAGLVVLTIAADRVTAPIVYEAPAEAPASAERFPHLYGPLNVDAVVAVTPLLPAADGSFTTVPDPSTPDRC
jgi:uncharacterized protein (DUF952 family)